MAEDDNKKEDFSLDRGIDFDRKRTKEEEDDKIDSVDDGLESEEEEKKDTDTEEKKGVDKKEGDNEEAVEGSKKNDDTPSFFDKINTKITNVTQSVSLQEKINLTRNLSIAVKSGSSLTGALKMVKGQTTSKALTRILEEVARDVNNGQFLAQSLAKHKHFFSDFFISVVRIGESTGSLTKNLTYLSDELHKQKELRSQVKAALIYPAIVFILAVAIALFLVFFILPKLLPVLTTLDVELPWPTRALMWTVQFAQSYWMWIILGIVALVMTIKFLLRVEKVRAVFDRALLSVPIIAPIVISLNLATFTRALGLLLKSGAPIVKALRVGSDTIQNKFYKTSINNVVESVRRGEEVTHYLEELDKPKLFPPIFISLIKIGEQTGNLEENLFYLSDYYEEEVENRLTNLGTVIEPVLLVVMGLVVGFIAVSIIVPIYKVTQGTVAQ